MSDFDPGQLVEPWFDIYFPIYTIGKPDNRGVEQIVYSPDGPCEVLRMSTIMRKSVVYLFTDEDLAKKGAEYCNLLGGSYTCIVRIDWPSHLDHLLVTCRNQGVEHVGTDIHLGPIAPGQYRPIQEVIDDCAEIEWIPEDPDDLP
jgi:hypothetical protein